MTTKKRFQTWQSSFSEIAPKFHGRPRPFSSRLMLDGHQGGTIRYLRELNGVTSCSRMVLTQLSGTSLATGSLPLAFRFDLGISASN